MEEEILQPQELNDQLPEEQVEDIPAEEEKPVYHPRPPYQVWAARVGLVIMIICVILYYWHIASGGKL